MGMGRPSPFSDATRFLEPVRPVQIDKLCIFRSAPTSLPVSHSVVHSRHASNLGLGLEPVLRLDTAKNLGSMRRRSQCCAPRL